MGLIDVYRINPADQFSVFSPSLKKTQEITYYTLLAKIRGDLNITSTSGNAAQWDEAYNETIISGVVTGYQTKTITLTRRDGSEISFSFQDLNPVSEDTLDMVTTRGNTTVNTIDVGGVRSDYFLFDTSATPTMQVGMMAWNAQDGTADLRLMGNNVTLQIGQEQVVRVVNKTGGDLLEANYQVVKITGAQGNRLKVGLARADSDANSADTIGIVTETIENNQEGFVTNSGLVRNINTTGSLQGETWVDGNVLYLSPTTYGRITNIKPLAPQHTVIVGFVVRAHPTQGQIFVKVDNGYEIDELHNVRITSVTNNQVLKYNSTLQVWENVDISTLATTLAFSTIAVTGQSSIVADTTQDTLNISPGTGISLTTNASTDTLTITNSAPDQIVSLTGAGTTSISGTYPNFTITSNDQYVGTVTSVSTSAPITGGTITTSGTIGITQAGSSSDGYLSSTDWNTFNSKSGYAFKTIAVAGQSSIVADAADDTLTVASGTGITLTTNASTDTLTITNNAPDQTVVLTAGTGISTSGTYPSFTITNTAPDQTVVLTAGTGITTSGTYPNFTITNNDRGSSQNIFKNFAVSGQSTIVADSNDDTLTVASGTGISLATNAVSDTLTITNTAPDQTVVLTAGTGISTSGTYPSFTITNTAPDQTVVLTAGTGITTSGTYPSFTITNNDRGSSQNIFKNVAVPTQSTITAANNNDTFTLKPGPGVSITTLTANNNITIANTDPGSSQYIFKNIAVSGQSTIVADINDDTLTVASGTGISVTTDAVTDTLTFTNTAPDQTVALTAGTGISVTGTYPNFTITNSSPSSGGTVTSIATTAPITGGTITSTGTIGITQAGVSTDGYLSSTDWNTFNNKQPALTNPITGTGTTNYVSKFTGTTTLGNSQIFDNGTNVGIGTASPATILDVNGTISVAGYPVISNSGNYNRIHRPSGTVGIYLGNATDAGNYYDNSTHYFRSSGGGTTYAVISAAGNVGIGTTSPATRLDVLGTSNADVTLQLKANASNDYNSKIFFSDNVSNRGVILYSNWQNYFSFFTNSSERVRIDSSGNVGIGTTSPAHKLSVVGNGSGIAHIGDAGTGGGNYVGASFNGTLSTSNYNILSSPTDPDLNINRPAGNSIRFREANAEQMRILSGGNVGIGTTSPAHKLDVVGNISLDEYLYHRDNLAQYLRFIDTSTTQLQSTKINFSLGSTSSPQGGDFQFASTSGSDFTVSYTRTGQAVWKQKFVNQTMYWENNVGNIVYFANNSGNVGIGTTSPTNRLEINSGTSASVFRAISSNTTSLRAFYEATAGNVEQHFLYTGVQDWVLGLDKADSNKFKLASADDGFASAKLTVTTAGNVGIGTTAPSSILHTRTAGGEGLRIQGTASSAFIRYTDASNVSTAFIGQNTTFDIYNQANTAMRFGTNDSERMRITAAGNVGIGTTNPLFRFHTVSSNFEWQMEPTSAVSAALLRPAMGGGAVNSLSIGKALSTNNISNIRYYHAADGSSSNYVGLGFWGNDDILNVVANGRVGIGTTSPNAKFEVQQNVDGNSFVTFQNTSTGTSARNAISIGNNNGNIASIDLFGGNYNVGSADDAANGLRIFNSGSGGIAIRASGASATIRSYVGSTEAMRISSTGNVGIATTSPFSRFTVSGALSASTSQISIVNTEGGHSIIRAGISGVTNNGMSFVTANVDGSSQNVRMVVGATGNVGIGTTSPAASLHVGANGGVIFGATAGAVGTAQITTTSATSPVSTRFAFGTDGTGWQYRIAKNTAGTIVDLVTVADNGRVGIGTTSPSTLLHVEGRIYAGDIGIATTSPTQKLHVVGNARITGAIFDSLNSSGTAGQVLSSTGTGTEWVTGGGGGGSTIIVKDEGTTVGSSFTTLDFYGSNIQAGASGSTAVITALNNAGTGSVYSNDTTAQYAPTASFANVEINTVTVEATAPDTAGTTQKLIATVTFGVENVSSFDNWNNFSFRLYNSNASSAIADTEHIWSAWMSKDEGVTRTVFTFHIPLYDGVGASDVVTVQAKQSTAYTPEIYYCAITLIEGTN